jgi:indoleamine 2,3-dioxygenase
MHTFLPKKDPLRTYKTNSRSLRKLENVASNLPKLLLTNKVQKTINSLNINSFSVNKIIKEESKQEINLAMSHLSFIAHSYIWGGNKPQSLLPQVIAEPWVKLSNYLGRPPILSYASYCLDNWYKIDKKDPISLDNVALINNFLGGVDEDWFVTIHVCIEDAAS